MRRSISACRSTRNSTNCGPIRRRAIVARTPACSKSAIPRRRRPPTGIGLLLYVKLSVTGNEPELIRRYRYTHGDFPHQSTLDQFFDQEQFEAYRQLGVHVAESLFAPALVGGEDPASIRNWFEALANNLLEPEK